MGFEEKAKATIVYRVEKYKAKDSKEIEEKKIKPYEVIESKPMDIELDCLLYGTDGEGIGNLIDLICGLGTPTAWNNANARIGVGNDGTAPAPAQTGLLRVSTFFKGMNTGYPQKSGANYNQSVWQADFISGEAEFAWLEETVDNGATPNKNLNRQNANLGTKPAGQTWRLTGTITWS